MQVVSRTAEALKPHQWRPRFARPSYGINLCYLPINTLTWVPRAIPQHSGSFIFKRLSSLP